MVVSPDARQRLFHVVMIKPTHYDDDGYPIQWVRSAIPSNTLACLNGLAEDAHRRKVLGPDVEICLHTYDETNRRVRPDQIIQRIFKAGGKALIALVGVQSNQFPRAVDLAHPFLAAGMPVSIGGFHISGCIAMLPEMPSGHARGASARHIVLCRRGRRGWLLLHPAARVVGLFGLFLTHELELGACERRIVGDRHFTEP